MAGPVLSLGQLNNAFCKCNTGGGQDSSANRRNIECFNG
jgi:hypothetical protein